MYRFLHAALSHHASKILATLAFALALPSIASATVAQPAIYWLEAGSNTGVGWLRQSDLNGGNVQDLISTDIQSPGHLQVDPLNAQVYWADWGTHEVNRADLNGLNAQTIFSGGASFRPSGIALDVSDNTVYWTDWGLDTVSSGPLAGGSIDDFVTAGLSVPQGVALDVANDKMYWVDAGTDKVQRADLDGNNVTDLVTGLIEPQGIALDVANNHMYWAAGGSDKIQRADLDGNNVIDLVLTGVDSNPIDIDLDLDNGHIYWADWQQGTINRADLNGGNVQTIVSGLTHPTGIAVVVPEPSSLILLTASGLGLLRRRRRGA